MIMRDFAKPEEKLDFTRPSWANQVRDVTRRLMIVIFLIMA